MGKKGLSKSALNALDSLEKRFGEPVVMKMDENNSGIKTRDSGRDDLNSALGGGYPKGGIIEIFGQEATGKTGLALDCVSKCLLDGGNVGYIDSEHALNTDYCKQVGINISELYLSQPDYGEMGFQAIRTMINTTEFDVIVVDSVSTMLPKAELEGETGESKMGLHARMMSQGLRQINAAAKDTETLVIFINQLRKSLASYGNPDVTTGGNALKFYAIHRLEIKNKGQLKLGDEVIGFKQHIRVRKNKIAPPFKEVSYDMVYGKGIDKLCGFIDALIFEGILVKKGAWISYDGTNIAQGMKKLRVMLEDNPELMEELKIKLNEARG